MEFQSQLFGSRRELTDAIAEAWMTAGGKNKPSDVDRMLDDGLDLNDAVDEMLEAWEIGPEWMAERGIDRSDLVAAFGRFAAERPDVVAGLACDLWAFRAYNSETLYAATDDRRVVEALVKRLNQRRDVNLYAAHKLSAAEIVASGVYKMQHFLATQDTTVDDVA